MSVVGVVENVAVHDLVTEAPMAAYYPWAQMPGGQDSGVLIVRVGTDPVGLAPAVRQLVGALEPRAAVRAVTTMREVVDAGMAENLRLCFFLMLFAAMALVLGTVGVYGVVSYAVERRQTELGVRMALGAQPARLLADVLTLGMLPVALGVIGGTVAALALSSVITGFLYEVAPTDPVALLAAATTLLVAGAVAALVHALRASRTDPAAVLRGE